MVVEQPQDPSADSLKSRNGNRLTMSDEKTPLVSRIDTKTCTSSDDADNSERDDENDANNGNIISILNYARRLIYVSHAFSQFSEVSWQFGLILFLAAFTHYKSMILVSTYGMTSWTAVCLFGASAGRFVDGTNRLLAAQRFIWLENIAVVIATILCYMLLLNLRNDNNDTTNNEDNNNHKASPWLYGVPSDRHSLLLLLGIHTFGPLAHVLDKGFLVSMERDWVVVMSEQAAAQATKASFSSTDATTASSTTSFNGKEDDENHEGRKNVTAAQAEWLSTTNVTMKQIDLTCQVIAPAVVGFVIAAFDPTPTIINTSNAVGERSASTNLTGAVLLVSFVNVAALVVEYICTARVYHLIPALGIKPEPVEAPPSSLSLSPRRNRTLSNADDGSSRSVEYNGSPTAAAAAAERSQQPSIANNADQNGKYEGENDSMGCGMGRQIRLFCGGGRRRRRHMVASWHGFRRQCLPDGLRIYFKQPVAWGGVGLSLLYFNCLTFGGLMTAYLVWKGMRFETVGIWRGISSALGLSGTVAYHASVRKTTLVNTGMWSIVLEFACLSLCFASFLVQDFSISVAMLIAGVCFSRVGLWVFDITIAQLMQEFIPENVRGIVGGTQQSINAFFQLGSFALGLIFPDPRDFWIYALAGYVAIALATLFYFFGVFLHASRFLTMAEKRSNSSIAAEI